MSQNLRHFYKIININVSSVTGYAQLFYIQLINLLLKTSCTSADVVVFD